VSLLYWLCELYDPRVTSMLIEAELTTDYFHAENFEGVGQGESHEGAIDQPWLD
jgi:hypothetical protein